MLGRLEAAKGRLLISEPFLDDPNFKRSVVLLTDLHDEGTVGFVLNHPSGLLLKDLLPEAAGSEFPLYIGGPVANDTIHFIHRCNDRLSDGINVGKGIYWGGNFEALKVLINKGQIQPQEIKFFLGYSGWGGDQLNYEIADNTWIVSDQFGDDMVFSADEEDLWRQGLIGLGPKFAHVSKFPHNPNLN